MRANEHQVVIAGAGPTGLTLAGELALAGVDVAVVERRETQELVGQRAGGLHARTIEVYDQRGIAERFLSAGQSVQAVGFAWIPLDISDFPSRHPHTLALWQGEIERILAEWVAELPVTVHRGREVTGLAQDDAGVVVELTDGATLRAEYLVGCDGGRSLVRKAAGIAFPGWDASTSALIGQVELTEEAEWGLRRDAAGPHALAPAADGVPARVMVSEREPGRTGEPTLADLREALVAAYGTDYGAHSPTALSRYTDMSRQAETYRQGRVLLAGDAAHIHGPQGGQGLNVGVQDAMNLGWKLAQVVRGTSPADLLDTYHAERHPIGARVLRDTMAMAPLFRGGERVDALREILAGLLAMDEPRRWLGAMLSGLDVRYDLGEGHPLLGRRMPDLDLEAAGGGPTRVFALLHEARPVLLNLGEAGSLDIAPWADRVRAVDATYAGRWELPAIGEVPAPAAVLIRPDGHVAWVGDAAAAGLADALTAWCGAPVG